MSLEIDQQDASELTAALNDERLQRSVLRRARMVRRLGVPGNSAAIAPLSLVLEIDPDDDVRGLAAIALGRIGDPLAASALRNALEEPYWPGQISLDFRDLRPICRKPGAGGDSVTR